MSGVPAAGQPGNPDLRNKPQPPQGDPVPLRQIHCDHLPSVGEVAVTVRRSSKWQTGVKAPHAVGRRPVVGEEIEVLPSDDEKVIGKIKVEQVHYLMFDQVPAKLTALVDDPKARTYAELLAKMRSYYGSGFNETEWVTVLVYRRIG